MANKMTIEGKILKEILPDPKYKKEGEEQLKTLHIYQEEYPTILEIKVPMAYKVEKHIDKKFVVEFSRWEMNGRKGITFKLV